jgi:uncharacterized coiled-coil DUF342 family protein
MVDISSKSIDNLTEVILSLYRETEKLRSEIKWRTDEYARLTSIIGELKEELESVKQGRSELASRLQQLESKKEG